MFFGITRDPPSPYNSTVTQSVTSLVSWPVRSSVESRRKYDVRGDQLLILLRLSVQTALCNFHLDPSPRFFRPPCYAISYLQDSNSRFMVNSSHRGLLPLGTVWSNLVLSSSLLASLELFEVPAANCHVALLLVHTFCEALDVVCTWP